MFGALVPAAQRAPLRLQEIDTALARTAGYPTIQAVLYAARANTAIGSENGVAAGEADYMRAYALAQAAGIGIALLRDLTAQPALTFNSGAVANALTTAVGTIQTVFQQPAGASPTTPTTPPLPGPTAPWSAHLPDAVQPLWITLQRPIGPLRAWQWIAAAGAGIAVLRIAAKAAKYAVLGGALAAGAYGVVALGSTFQGRNS